MEETLAPGVRKLAEWEETSDLFFASVQEEAALLRFRLECIETYSESKIKNTKN